MDRAFLAAYEAELGHIRELAGEFAALHPNVARNLSLESQPCPDPYVERLLEGVAFLAARTRIKVEAEGQRFTAGVLEALWPDLAAPAPAMCMTVLHPGPQVQTMANGHVVARGSRFSAASHEGLATRATYSTAQDVTLWPIALKSAAYLPDRGALAAAGIAVAGAEAGITLTLQAAGQVGLAAMSLDRLDICYAGSPRAPALFDGVFGHAIITVLRPAGAGAHPGLIAPPPGMVGVDDSEGLTPRLRQSFEGFRLLRDYFLMPERFHFLRLHGLADAIRDCGEGEALDIAILFSRPQPGLAGLSATDLRLFGVPMVNIFEKECNFVELEPRATAHPVHADRGRTRDFEIFRLLRVADADREGEAAVLCPVHAPEARRRLGARWWTERRPRRPASDEVRRGQMRSSYPGDDLWISVSRSSEAPRRLDIRALCTNRDIPILDDTPRLTPEGAEPVSRVELLGTMRRPQPALSGPSPQAAGRRGDDLTWRLVAQLSSGHLSLAEAGRDGAPLAALLGLYADRGDPALARHARAVASVSSRPVIERLALPGPLAFGRGDEITLEIDESMLAGASHLLLPALLDRLFARHASVNAFVRSRTRLIHKQEEVTWPMRPGLRARI